MKIKITKRLQGYIIEHLQEGEVIPSSTHVFCGNCGGSIGVVKKPMKFPFNWIQMESNMRDTRIFVTSQGITCQHCNHLVSFTSGDLRFTPLKRYLEFFPADKHNEGSATND